MEEADPTRFKAVVYHGQPLLLQLSRPTTRSASSTSATRTTGRGPSPSTPSSPRTARRNRCGSRNPTRRRPKRRRAS
eukprot:5764610-Prymnesium_polylepis.1